MDYGDYLYQLGLIDSNGRDVFLEYQKKGIDCIVNKDFNCAFEVFDQLINMDELPEGSLFKNLTGFNIYFNYLKTSDDAAAPLGDFLQKSETRRAIHVGNNSFHDLDGENKVEEHLKLDVMDSVADWVAELLSHYPVLVYNGQLDIIVAYPLTENYLKSLNFDGADQYKTAKRYIWRVDNDVAGYAKHAGNLTEVLVRNAGQFHIFLGKTHTQFWPFWFSISFSIRILQATWHQAINQNGLWTCYCDSLITKDSTEKANSSFEPKIIISTRSTFPCFIQVNWKQRTIL